MLHYHLEGLVLLLEQEVIRQNRIKGPELWRLAILLDWSGESYVSILLKISRYFLVLAEDV